MAGSIRKDHFRILVEAIVSGDSVAAIRMLDTAPSLAMERAAHGAIRQAATQNFFHQIKHYMYEGDTALHMAAAAYQTSVAAALITKGADVRSRNRRGAEPLHYAADGGPDTHVWNPSAQAKIIATLIRAGADANAIDKSGVSPLHRAIRNRCSAAVKALVEAGADPRAPNRNGSTPVLLATQNTGKSGSGSAEAKAQQEEILHFLRECGCR